MQELQQVLRHGTLRGVCPGFQAPRPSEEVHGSKHLPGPVAIGMEILDEDDRKPGYDPDKLSAHFADAVNPQPLIRYAVSCSCIPFRSKMLVCKSFKLSLVLNTACNYTA